MLAEVSCIKKILKVTQVYLLQEQEKKQGKYKE